MAQNGVIEDATGDLLRYGEGEFVAGAGETVRDDVPVPAIRRYQMGATLMSRFDGTDWIEVDQPTTPNPNFKATLGDANVRIPEGFNGFIIDVGESGMQFVFTTEEGLVFRIPDTMGFSIICGGAQITAAGGLLNLSPHPVPAGLIAMWSGLLSAIPDGWILCDGSNGTPDLRSKFIKGAADGVDPGATGGSVNHTPAGTINNHGTAKYSGLLGGIDAFNSPVTHTFTGTSADFQPPYFALAYIMKL